MEYVWPLINDNVHKEDRRILSDFILSNGRLTNGEKVKEFEDKWSKWLGNRYSTMVNSGSSGNFISMGILKSLKGLGEVIVSPLGWVSDISSILQLGFTPVFVDISLTNLSITAENIKNAITSETKAIVLVHCLGFNAISDEIIKIAKDNDLLLIEDCCEAHGASYKEKKVGTFGDISIFSFYFGHHMTTVEGGMICVNDSVLDDFAKLYRSHGMTREASPILQEKYKGKFPQLNPLFTFAVPGFNMRSTEINAVLGIEQLKRLDDNIEKRKKNLEIWLDNLDNLIFHTNFDINGSSNFALPLVIKPDYVDYFDYNDDYSSIKDKLDLSGVEYRIGTAGGGNQTLQPYLEGYNYRIVGDLSNTNYIHNNSLYIGNHTDLTEIQIIELCKKLNDVYGE